MLTYLLVGDTTVILVRHGRTAWHRPNRYAGVTDLPLDEAGERQAEALGRYAAGGSLTSLASSPLVRARATAGRVAEATGLPVRVDDRLRELDFGMAEGRTLDAVRAEHPEVADRFVADPATDHFPGGEPPADAAARADAAVRELVAADPGGTILVVAHSTLLRLLICTLIGVPLRDYRRRLPGLDPVAISQLRYPTAPAAPVTLVTYNQPVAVEVS